jgi:hypothetical protein
VFFDRFLHKLKQKRRRVEVGRAPVSPDGNTPTSLAITFHPSVRWLRVIAGSARNAHGTNSCRDMVHPLGDHLSFRGSGESAAARYGRQAHRALCGLFLAVFPPWRIRGSCF